MNLKKDLKHNAAVSSDTAEGGFRPTAFRVPDGVEIYKPKLGTNRLDIIPFVDSDGHARYYYEYYQHISIGLNSTREICLAKTYNAPCPVCEERARLKAEGRPWDDEDVKALNPKRRVMYNVLDRDEPEKGIQLFEVSHYLFERLLIQDAKEQNVAGEDSDPIFADLTDGRTVCFKGREKEFAGRTSVSQFDSFRFEDREKPYPEDYYKQAHNLAEILTPMDYATFKSLFYGIHDDDDDDVTPEPVAAPEVKVNPADDLPFPSAPDPEPAPVQPVRKKKQTACPYELTFGVHFDSYDVCDECAVRAACSTAAASN